MKATGGGGGARQVDEKRYAVRQDEGGVGCGFVSIVLGVKDFAWYTEERKGGHVVPPVRPLARKPKPPVAVLRKAAVYQIRGNLLGNGSRQPPSKCLGISLINKVTHNRCKSLVRVERSTRCSHGRLTGVDAIDTNWTVSRYTKQQVTRGWARLEQDTATDAATDPTVDRPPPHHNNGVAPQPVFKNRSAQWLQISPMHTHADEEACPGTTPVVSSFIFRDPSCAWEG
eukprot:TRINITY_DN40116_c0_g1_i1.p1 TRINITY_DN40116_c0_g1~~TRINITY_DN40116_c0_g1_i1.p1  ORF type:complete len:228 (+),score=8.70 TRINITY_DN40116_c0_g1_i1:50-733(+)